MTLYTGSVELHNFLLSMCNDICLFPEVIVKSTYTSL